MSELGLWTLALKFSPGTLLEASLFRPLPTAYKDLFWDTVLLASEKLTTTLAPSSSSKQSPPNDISLPLTTLARPKNEIPLPSISITLDPTASSSTDVDRMKHVSSLESVTSALDPHWSAGGGSNRMHTKAKSFGDLEQLEQDNSTDSPQSLPLVSKTARLKGSGTYRGEKKSRPSSQPSMKRDPLFPSMNQLIHSRTLVSRITASLKESGSTVVQQSLETTPSRLCSTRRSVTPTALASTSLLPEQRQGQHYLEVHHLSTTGAGSQIFSILLQVLLFVFLFFPLIRRWLTNWAPTREATVSSCMGLLPKTEEIAKAKYYADRSPTTMTSSVIRAMKLEKEISKPLPLEFRNKNAQTVVVGAIGTKSEYLASSSNQPTEKLKFVEVRAPAHLGPTHSDAVCTALTAIALATSEPTPRSSGVVPPLSAGGKVLRDLLLAEGFAARSVSLGKK